MNTKPNIKSCKPRGFNLLLNTKVPMRFMLMVIYMLAYPVWAQDNGDNPIPDYYQEPGIKSIREYNVGPDGTEFIDPFNGVLRLNYTDLVIPGNGGFDISITRNYQSLQNPAGVVGGAVLPGYTTTGVGWDIHFGRVLDYNFTFTAFSGAQCRSLFEDSRYNPVLELPDGSRQVLFNALPDDTDTFDMITKERWILNCEGNGILKIKSPEGMIYTMGRYGAYMAGYPSAYHPTRIEDRNGNYIEIFYKPDSTTYSVLFDRIEASDGRRIDFIYENENTPRALLRQIISEGRTWTYHYTDIPNVGTNHVFLSRVEGPEGLFLEWQYQYYGDGSIECPSIAASLYSVCAVTAPYGGKTTYTYQRIDLGAHAELDMDTVAVQTKTVSNMGVAGANDGTWTYTFEGGVEPDNFDRTIINTPVSREVYYHCGMSAWQVGESYCNHFTGALIEKTIYEPETNGAIKQRERYLWGNTLISEQNERLPYRLLYNVGTTSKMLLQKTVQISGEDYTSAYYNFDGYGNPQLIEEYTGPAADYYDPSTLPALNYDYLSGHISRQISLNYYINRDRWIIKQEKDKTVYDYIVSLDGQATNGNGVYTIARTYDDHANLTSVNQYGITTSYDYDPQGNMIRVTDALGRVTTYANHFRGIPQIETHPVGLDNEGNEKNITIARGVNGDGTIDYEIDGRGNRTNYAYDQLGRLTNIATPRMDDQNITITYLFPTRKRTLTRGSFKEINTYDGFGKLIQTSTDNIVKQFQYDKVGRKIYESDPYFGSTGVGSGTRFQYDAIGRVERITHTADGSDISYQYNCFGVSGSICSLPLGRGKIRITNERGISTDYTYQAYGDPDNKALVRVESPEGVITDIKRYSQGAAYSITQRSLDGSIQRSRQFFLNERNELAYELHPETGRTAYTYNAVGDRISSQVGFVAGDDDADGINNEFDYCPNTPLGEAVDINGCSVTQLDNGFVSDKIFYTYDWQSRLIGIDYPNNANKPPELGGLLPSPDVSYEYDNHGNLLRLVKGDTAWAYTYDENNNLKNENLTVDGQMFNITYDYNAQDALQTTTLPSGLNIDYAPNSLGWPTQVGTFASITAYHPTGQINTIDYSNGISRTMTLNARLFPDNIQDSSNILDLTYTYDASGNIESIYDAVISQNSLSLLQYDGLNRLTLANGPWGTGAIEYNALGNITKKTIGDFDINYNYSNNGFGTLLNSVTGSKTESYGRDTHGNTAPLYWDANQNPPVAKRSHHYDYANHLLSANQGTISWRYDGNNRRVSSTENGQVKNYTVYNHAGQLVYELENVECQARDYIKLGSVLVARRDDSFASQDSDGDGIPDCDEYRMGLSPNDPLDADYDADNDGLTNLEEYQNNTDHNNIDTDNDGISDGYEVLYGLNPLNDDSYNDPDGDGANNLKEFLGGTDPNDPSSIPELAFGTVLWSFESEFGWFDTRPAIGSDGTSYIATNYIAGKGSVLYAIKPNGKLKWKITSEWSYAPPAVSADGTVYTASNKNLYAYHPDGTLKWSAQNLNIVRLDQVSMGISHDDVVYYAGDSIGAVNPDGTVKWHLPNEGYGSPVVGKDGAIYTQTDPYGLPPKLVAISPSGIEQWSFNTESLAGQPPAIGSDGKIYFGDARAPNFYAINPDGTVHWIVRLPENLKTITTPVIDFDGTIFVSAYGDSNSGYVFAINMDGSIKWRSEKFSHSSQNLVLGNAGKLYVIADLYGGFGIKDNFYAIDRATGNISQSAHLPGNSEYSSALTITDEGTFYATTRSNSYTGLYHAFTADATALENAPWPKPGQNNANTSSYPVCELPDTDQDGIPDCEEMLNGLDFENSNDSEQDNDNDGLSNLQEFMQATHYYNPDSDNDGLNDSIEPSLGLDNKSSDTDADGMSDGYEVQNGLNPLSNDAFDDTDLDGFINIDEFREETAANDSSSYPEFLLISTNFQRTRSAFDGHSSVHDISDDGRFILFESHSQEVVETGGQGLMLHDVLEGATVHFPARFNSNDAFMTNNAQSIFYGSSTGIYRYDRALEESVLISINPEGLPSGSPYLEKVTRNGLFALIRDNLGALYVRDVQQDISSLVNININGTGIANRLAHAGGMSEDGRFVLFSSEATDLVPIETNYRPNIFVRDMQNNITYLVSINASGTASGNDDSGSQFGTLASMSADGRYVTFISEASDLVENDINNNEDIFIRDLQNSKTYLVSVDINGQSHSGQTYNATYISPDGRYVAFSMKAPNMVEGIDTSLFYNIFIRDIQKGETYLVTKNYKDDAAGNGDSGTSGSTNYGYEISFTKNSRYITFISEASNLVETDTNDKEDAFIYDLEKNVITLVSTNRNKTDSADKGGYHIALTPDGRYAAIVTNGSDIVPNDFNSDDYDSDLIRVELYKELQTDPVIEITSPPNQAIFIENELIIFNATSQDVQDGDISENIMWFSDLDGNIGIGATISIGLSIGSHIITASITDSDGATSEDIIEITVNPVPNALPTIEIISPENNAEFFANDNIIFSANANDVEDGDLSADIQWSSNIDGSLGSGSNISTILSVGTHTVTATVADSGNATGSAIVTIVVQAVMTDDDGDGVDNNIDQCPNTPAGEGVDANGCSASQLDDDNDGVNNAVDQCPNTPEGEVADSNGCSASQLDDDNDGVNNAIDQCPNTPAGEAVDANGCSASQLDDDNDGVNNALDQCPNTPVGEVVDANGCSVSQLDDDNDGVNNAVDQCPNTPIGEAVDANGCSASQLDDDNDGVNNALDQCPNTPTGEAVDANGCSASQLDDDNDGVNNAIDQCPNTPAGEAVDANGCSASQLDDDNDGVSNALDQCPNTPVGEAVDANGCSASQLDDDSDGVNNAIDQCPNTPAGETVDANGCSASQINLPAESVELNINLSSPQRVGTLIIISAQASGGSGDYEYQFRIRGTATGDTWRILQDYSPVSTLSWDTTDYTGINRLQVLARNIGSDDTPVRKGKNFTVLATGSASEVELTASPSSPQAVGSVINLSAQATGGSGEYEYQFQFRNPDANEPWQILQPYSRSASALWDSNARSGRNRLRVLARNVASDDPPVFDTLTFWINSTNALTEVQLQTNTQSPAIIGTIVTLTAQASGGSDNYEYQFRISGIATDNNWQLLQDFSNDNTVAWDTTGYPGNNQLQVRARNAGSNDLPVRDSKRFWVNQATPATEVTLISNLPSPQSEGTTLQLTTQADGGSGDYQYRFRYRGPSTNDQWVILQDYSSNNTVTWNTSGHLGANRLQVHARNSGSEDQPVKATLKMHINSANPATAATINLSPNSPQPAGTLVQITGQGTGGNNNYDYQYRIRGPATGDTWQILQDYTNNANLNWDTSVYPGQNRIQLRLRNASSLDIPVKAAKNYIVE